MKWSGKTRGGLLGYKFFGLLIKKTNLKIVYAFLRVIVFYFFLFSKKKPTRFYFSKVLGYSYWKTVKGIFNNYYMLGQVLIDKISFLSGAKNNFTFEYQGEEYLHQMAEGQKGGILLGAHVGNWEVAGNLLKRIDTTVNVLMLDAEHEKIKKYVSGLQGEQSFNIIPIKDDMSHLALIKQAFAKNEFVAMHGDRFLPGVNTVEVNFLGKSAKFPTGPLYMASKFKVPVSFVYTVKDTPSHYHFYATKPKIYPYPSKLKTRETDIFNMVSEYVASLETIVQKYPYQWFNYYHFWENNEL